jgi:hypothetical protein
MTTFEQMIRQVPPDVPARPLCPWLTMFIRPRQTMRQILDGDPTRFVVLLAMFGGVLMVLDRASIDAMGDRMPVTSIFAMAIPVGVIVGLIMLYLGGAVIRWTGSWFGGRATAAEVRAALAWGRMPFYWAGLLWLPFLGLFGGEVFMGEMPSVEAQPWLLLVLLNLAVLEMGLGIWGLVTLVFAVAEAHRFPAWNSLGSIVVAMVLIVVPFIVLAMIAGVMRVLW